MTDDVLAARTAIPTKRLSARRLDDLCARTLELVISKGLENVTMDEVACATSSSKATLYRRWAGKVDLVVAALAQHGAAAAPPADQGSLRDDLLAMLMGATDERPGRWDVLGALLSACRHDHRLAQALRVDVVEPFVADVEVLLQRASDRGEMLPEAVPPTAAQVTTALLGLLVADVTGLAPDRSRDIAAYVDGVVLPFVGV